MRTSGAILIAATAALAVVAASPAGAGAPAVTYFLGDVNCDESIDSIDAALLLQRDAGLVASLSCEDAADASEDGTINSIDAAVVLQYFAGLIPALGSVGEVTYFGTHAQGGTVEFTVSADGTRVVSFVAENFCGDPDRGIYLVLESIRITGQYFEWEQVRGDYSLAVTGTLLSDGSASGTVSYADAVNVGCHPQLVPWIASVG